MFAVRKAETYLYSIAAQICIRIPKANFTPAIVSSVFASSSPLSTARKISYTKKLRTKETLHQKIGLIVGYYFWSHKIKIAINQFYCSNIWIRTLILHLQNSLSRIRYFKTSLKSTNWYNTIILATKTMTSNRKMILYRLTTTQMTTKTMIWMSRNVSATRNFNWYCNIWKADNSHKLKSIKYWNG